MNLNSAHQGDPSLFPAVGETAEENSLHYMWLTVILAHPEYIHINLQRNELISRGSVLYRVRAAKFQANAVRRSSQECRNILLMGIQKCEKSFASF